MKILSKEEEEAHYNAVLRGGFIGGGLGLAVGLGGAVILNKRWPFFKHLTLPLKTFFVTSSATFGAIVHADTYSRKFEKQRHGYDDISDATQRAMAEARANMSSWERAKDWGREYRYPIVTGSWAASMAASLAMVSRNKYLTTSQKLVQARMYAQGLTLLVLVATAAFEVSDSRDKENEKIKVVDPSDPKHQRIIEKTVHHEQYPGEDMWRDMVEAEERRMKAREAAKNKGSAAAASTTQPQES